jgi:hypothetical protein
MTYTTSLVHQPLAEDLGCGLPFTPSAVTTYSQLRRILQFYTRIEMEEIKNIRGWTKRLSNLINISSTCMATAKLTWDIGNPWTNVLLDPLRIFFHKILESIVLIVYMSALEKKCSLVQPLRDMLLLSLAPRAGDRGGNPGLSIYPQVSALAQRGQGQCSFPQIRSCSSRAFFPQHYGCSHQCL